MKHIKIGFIFSLLLVTSISRAQVSITSADMPLLNDTIRVSMARSFSGINIQLTDTNYVWDYSFLMPDSQRIEKFVLTSQTPYGSVFGTVFVPSTYGVRNYSPDPVPFILLGQAPQESYDFYASSASNYKQVGYGVTALGQALPLIYYAPPFTLTPDIIYKFPLNYGNIDSSKSGFAYPLAGYGFYGVDKKRVNLVDGWGKLKTPFGEFDALRVKSTITQTDTIYLDSLGFGLRFPRPIRYEYKWLGKGCKIPLLQVDVTDIGGNLVINRVIYRDSMWTDMTSYSISTSTCPGAKEGTLEVLVSGGKAPYLYSGNTGQNTKYMNGLGEGEYTVIVTDKYGKSISITDTIEGRMQAIACLLIPNAFTPNDDLVNDVWNIRNIHEYPDCEVEIYNRWGSLIYISAGYANPWNGKYNGENSPTGTYYYKIKVNNKIYQGPLTIIR